MFISVKKRKWKCWYLVQMLNFDLDCFKPLSWTEALKMPPVKSVIPSNPKSKVWRHFGDSLDGEFAQCLICKDSKTIAIHIKVCGGSTQSLRNHIKFHHKKEFRDMVWYWSSYLAALRNINKVQNLSDEGLGQLIFYDWDLYWSCRTFWQIYHLRKQTMFKWGKKTKKVCCQHPILEHHWFYWHYSLLGRVVNFPSRVRVVKKIPSTGWVASTRHSLATGVRKQQNCSSDDAEEAWRLLCLCQGICLQIWTPPVVNQHKCKHNLAMLLMMSSAKERLLLGTAQITSPPLSSQFGQAGPLFDAYDDDGALIIMMVILMNIQVWWVLSKKIVGAFTWQKEGQNIWAWGDPPTGCHNLRLVLISKFSQNFVLKMRMLCFSRHSRQKCRKSRFLEQNSCF